MIRFIIVALLLTSCCGCVIGKGTIRVEYPDNSGAKVAASIDFEMVR